MDRFVIEGERTLSGTVAISGAKNAVLPMMAASLLASGKTVLTNVPDLRDTHTMAHLLRIIGARVDFHDHTLEIDTSNCSFPEAPYDLVKTMRASFYVFGPLAARFGRARVSMPGGCAWGPRPVDLHIAGIEQLGAKVELEGGYLVTNGVSLHGANIALDISSVGATGNILMAAVLAKGETTITNAAREPEICTLADFLVSMGADIEGIGTNSLHIRGVDDLHPTDAEVIPDRIEAATFLVAGAMSGGEVEVTDVAPEHLTAITEKLSAAGATLTVDDRSITVVAPETAKSIDVTTAVYSGFPTDLQAQWIALMSTCNGQALVTDTIFVDRFTHVAELNRLGADIRVTGNTATVRGVHHLTGAQVMSTDIRASASLILAGLVARGRTEVQRVYHIDRGYEAIEQKLQKLGAAIWREED